MDDAAAAYVHALLYVTSGNVAHAVKSAQIMDAWSAVLKQHTNTNAPLQAAWAGSVFPRAAEIIRHKWDGWPAANIARFEKMLQSAFLPLIIQGCFGYNGNWELSMAEVRCAPDFGSPVGAKPMTVVYALGLSPPPPPYPPSSFSSSSSSSSSLYGVTPLKAIFSIAVFTEDTQSFAVALNLWRGRVHGARFRQKSALEDAIEFHAFAPLEALPCV
jgi:hypothetical protein